MTDANDAGKSGRNKNSAVINVLIADDDVLTSRMHEALMDQLGLEVNVRLVANGSKALELCLAGESFDIIFVDREMAIIDGEEATREMRKNGVKSLIVGTTSDSSEDAIKDFKAAGLDECFVKPLTIDNIQPLLQKIQKQS